MRIALAEGEPTLSGGVAAVDVDDVKAHAERLRDEGVEVGTVLELAGPDAARRRVRPGRQPRAAHAGDRVIRKGSAADVPFMRSMLAHAYAWRVNAFEADIPLSRYVDNWGRPGDVARDRARDGQPRRRGVAAPLPRVEPGYGFVDEQTPELSIAVVPSRRRHGLGQELMDALLEAARAAGHGAVSLSVEDDSPAVAFYERNGFERVREQDGGLVMQAHAV